MENKKEIKNKRITGDKMKIKEKIMEYFQTYWRRGKFMKIVSLIVALCFVTNIIQPALVFGDNTTEDMRKRQRDMVRGGGTATSGVINPNAGTVNQKVDLNNVVHLSQEMKVELSQQNITINKFGNVIDQKKGPDKPIGSVDDNGKVTVTFDDAGRAEKDEAKRSELQGRVDEYYSKGGVKGNGQYKTTLAAEYRTENRPDVKEAERETEAKTEAAAVRRAEEQKDEKISEIEGNIAVDNKVETTVSQEQEVVTRQNVNEQSAEEKQAEVQKAIRDGRRESTSVTRATIEKVQATGAQQGQALIAVRNAAEETPRISLYQNEDGTENIYVGISNGKMAYANHSGDVNVREYSDNIKVEGHVYTKTEISLVSGKEENEDGSINKRVEGLFAAETLLMVKDGEVNISQDPETKGVMRAVIVVKKTVAVLGTVGAEIAENGAEIADCASTEIKNVMNGTLRNVLAVQPVAAEIAVNGTYSRESVGSESVSAADAKRVGAVLESYAMNEQAVSQEAVTAAVTETAATATQPTTSNTTAVTETKSFSSYINPPIGKGGALGKITGSIGKRTSVNNRKGEQEFAAKAKESGLSVIETNALINKAREDGVSAEGLSALFDKAKEEGVSVQDLYRA
ncbi:MAG: hypothetical protein FWG57_00070, partial [Endomicrobia bacterium]|nr:hypothetical protein [Endomicrobiia bacterium]